MYCSNLLYICTTEIEFITYSTDWWGLHWINIWPSQHTFICAGSAQTTMSDSAGKIPQHNKKSWDTTEGYLRVCHSRQWPSGKLSFQTSSPEEEQAQHRGDPSPGRKRGGKLSYNHLFFYSQQTLCGLPRKKVMERIHQNWDFSIKANSAGRTNQSLEWASSWWGLDIVSSPVWQYFFHPFISWLFHSS